MCEISYDDGPCTIWEEKHVRARKEHVCSCCHAIVWPGEKYTTHFSLFDGEATYEKCCSECDVWRQLFGSVPEHHGVPGPGYFREVLGDCIGSGGEEDLVWRIARFRIRRRELKAKRLRQLTPLFPIVAHLAQEAAL